MRKTLLFLLLLCMIASYCNRAYADILYLKNGKKISGKIIKATAEDITIDCMGIGFLKKYKRSTIKSIKKTQDTAPIEKAQQPTSVNLPAESKESVLVKQDETIENEYYILYIPKGIEKQKKYPLVLGFHPGGNAQAVIQQWQPLAEKYKLIICATKESRNGGNMLEKIPRIKNRIEREVLPQYPVHKRKIIATGISGGGMCAHFMTFMFNDFLAAVVVNTGMMNDYQIDRQHKCARNKRAVMLASPTDFRYDEMRRDNSFLKKQLDWKTKWLEFDGGHIPAPQKAYEQGLEWLLQELSRR